MKRRDRGVPDIHGHVLQLIAREELVVRALLFFRPAGNALYAKMMAGL